MKELLLARFKQQVTRREFLRRWGRLRKGLRASVEYQELLISLARRSDGICEKCMVRPARECHHVERVAYNPDRALDLDNTIHLCTQCHEAQH